MQLKLQNLNVLTNHRAGATQCQFRVFWIETTSKPEGASQDVDPFWKLRTDSQKVLKFIYVSSKTVKKNPKSHKTPNRKYWSLEQIDTLPKSQLILRKEQLRAIWSRRLTSISSILNRGLCFRYENTDWRVWLLNPSLWIRWKNCIHASWLLHYISR